MNPFLRSHCNEWQAATQHFVKYDTNRIQVTPRIDGPVHTPRQLGRHVRKRADKRCRGVSSLMPTRRADGRPKAREPRLSGRDVDQDVLRLDVTMDESSFVQPACCAHQTNGNAEE